MERITGEFTAVVKASGLDAPAGMALHPETRELYLAEKKQVSVIREGRAVPVIASSWRVVRDMDAWLVTDEHPLSYWVNNTLQRPKALAFASDGRLFVTENVPAGRVMEFTPDIVGAYVTARIIGVPWLQYNYTWKSIAVASDGFLILSGITEESPGSPPYGSVVMRDADEEWWAVDYGPFARFTSLGLSRDNDIAVVADETTDTVVWWDTIRHLAIDSAPGKTDNVKGVGVFPDGSIATLEEPATRPGEPRTARLVRIDPQTGQSRIVAQGFGEVSSMIVAPDNGHVYLTEQGDGLLIELQPKVAFLTNNYLLQRSVSAFEARGGLAPRSWPPYLQNFVRKLGVEPASEREAAKKIKARNAVRAEKEANAETKTGENVAVQPVLTPQSFGMKVPFIAGMVKSDPSAIDASTADPIRQVDFIVFFPANSLKKGDFSTPSLSLFTARHQSGREHRSVKLAGLGKTEMNTDGSWTKATEKTTLFIPMATCAATPTEDGVEVSICFLGLDIMDDYYMQFRLGKAAEGRLIVNGQQQTITKYNMTLTEMDEETGTEVPTVVMAGFNRRKAEPFSWLKIGVMPQEYFLQLEDRPPWKSRWMSEVTPEINVMLQKKEADLRASLRRTMQEEISAGAAASDADTPARDNQTPAASGSEQRPQRVEAARPATPATAMTDPESEEDAYWTNMILTRAAQVWLGEN
ncbi:MAG: hypothetical protein V1929_01560 [bacterium]